MLMTYLCSPDNVHKKNCLSYASLSTHLDLYNLTYYYKVITVIIVIIVIIIITSASKSTVVMN